MLDYLGGRRGGSTLAAVGHSHQPVERCAKQWSGPQLCSVSVEQLISELVTYTLAPGRHSSAVEQLFRKPMALCAVLPEWRAYTNGHTYQLFVSRDARLGSTLRAAGVETDPGHLESSHESVNWSRVKLSLDRSRVLIERDPSPVASPGPRLVMCRHRRTTQVAARHRPTRCSWRPVRTVRVCRADDSRRSERGIADRSGIRGYARGSRPVSARRRRRGRCRAPRGIAV